MVLAADALSPVAPVAVLLSPYLLCVERFVDNGNCVCIVICNCTYIFSNQVRNLVSFFHRTCPDALLVAERASEAEPTA